MTRFRPCIDLHAGSVKQIVGGTLTTTDSDLKTNYVSEKPSSYYAQLYKDSQLAGAHVIMLGPGNDNAAKEACQAWPRGLQVGGGISDANAKQWIENGAEKVSLSFFSCYLAFVIQATRSAVCLFLGFPLAGLHVLLSQKSPPCREQPRLPMSRMSAIHHMRNIGPGIDLLQ